MSIIPDPTSSVGGFEALIRWRNGERGCAPPDVFIPLAEKSDIIVELGLFALRETTAVANKWDLGDKCFVQVNASAHPLKPRSPSGDRLG